MTRLELLPNGIRGSGLSLRSDDLDPVGELYTEDDLRQLRPRRPALATCAPLRKTGVDPLFVDTGTFEVEESTMGKSRRAYTPEFRPDGRAVSCGSIND